MSDSPSEALKALDQLEETLNSLEPQENPGKKPETYPYRDTVAEEEVVELEELLKRFELHEQWKNSPLNPENIIKEAMKETIANCGKSGDTDVPLAMIHESAIPEGLHEDEEPEQDPEVPTEKPVMSEIRENDNDEEEQLESPDDAQEGKENVVLEDIAQ